MNTINTLILNAYKAIAKFDPDDCEYPHEELKQIFIKHLEALEKAAGPTV